MDLPTAQNDSIDVNQLQAWNQTATDYPKDQTIVSLFEQQVKQTLDKIAVVFVVATI